MFVELKKKYQSVVYNRRMALPEQQATDWLCGGKGNITDTQIAREIGYFARYYETLCPVLFLSYEREAYYSRDGSDLRITFDDTLLCRQDRLTLSEEPDGIPLLEEGKVLMEIKTSGGIPLWMTKVLSSQQIYKTSFSKYGTAYAQLIFPQLQGK